MKISTVDKTTQSQKVLKKSKAWPRFTQYMAHGNQLSTWHCCIQVGFTLNKTLRTVITLHSKKKTLQCQLYTKLLKSMNTTTIQTKVTTMSKCIH